MYIHTYNNKIECRERLRKVAEDCRGLYIGTYYTHVSIISPFTRPTRVLPTNIKINIITDVKKK
jgi:hypothetical protein